MPPVAASGRSTAVPAGPLNKYIDIAARVNWLWWVLLAVVLAAVAFVLWYWVWPRLKAFLGRRRAAQQEALGRLHSDDLLDSWRRFVRSVPLEYQQELGKFEHVVVSGDAKSGKRALIENYSDFRRQAHLYLRSQLDGGALQVYVGSGVLITELPSSLLSETSTLVRAALKELWCPLYRERLPVFVAVVDAVALSRMPQEQVETLALKLRAQVNALSEVGRKHRVRVRVVATCLDQLEGWAELAELYRCEEIPLHIPIATGQLHGPGVLLQLEAWLASAREQLPRALTHLEPGQFTKLVRFLRSVDAEPGAAVLDRLSLFIDALFQSEAISSDPTNEGLFLAGPVAANPNPLRNPDAQGRVQNPLWGPFKNAFVPYLVFLFVMLVLSRWQGSSLLEGKQRLENCVPKSGAEAAAVTKIANCLSLEIRQAATTPWWGGWCGLDMQASARAHFRADIAARVRRSLANEFIRVAKRSTTEALEPLGTLWMRTATLLALIHGDKHDYFDVLDRPELLSIAQDITGLDKTQLEFYLNATEKADATPVVWHSSEDRERRDPKLTWYSVIADARAALEHQTDALEVLSALSERARIVKHLRSQEKQERRALDLYAQLDEAAAYHNEVVTAQLEGRAAKWSSHDVCTDNPKEDHGALESAYEPLFQSGVDSKRYPRLCTENDLVMRVLDEIALEHTSEPEIHTLAALNNALEQIRVPAQGEEHALVALHFDRDAEGKYSTFSFDLNAWHKLTRRARAMRLVTRMIEDSDVEPFQAESPSAEKPLSWNTSLEVDAMFLGTKTIAAEYSRSHYERFVRGELLRHKQIMEKLGISLPAALDQQLKRYLETQVQRYAENYALQLRNLIEDFTLATNLSEPSLRVLLTLLVAERSPLTHFVSLVADQARADTSNVSELAAMKEALAPFASWASMMGDTQGEGELQKYRAILSQLLATLEPASGERVADNGEPPASLEAALSPVGRAALVELLQQKGGYRPLVTKWVEGLRLPPNQVESFIQPIDALCELGAMDISRTIGVLWRREMKQSLIRLANKFPFDPHAREDATPSEVSAELHPRTGALFTGFRRYLEPVSSFGDGRSFAEHPALRLRVPVPTDMYPTLNALAGLSAKLFDGDGKAKPLRVSMRTEALPRTANPSHALTAAFVGVDTATFYEFNQQDVEGALLVDWTRPQIAQVGGQYTSLGDRNTTFAEPIASPSSYWSLWRLLRRADVDKQSALTEEATYIWRISGPSRAGEQDAVRFRLLTDPWKAFAIPLVPAEVGAGG
ncbi:MAG: hypothetical protein JWN04_6624 [Myxococcaceae bacterium]|nr:hypothetical protein [Myxococcaceae bacterium]